MAGRRAFDGWSRLVGWLKVVLPLAALAILSTLFLVSNRIDPEGAIPYTSVDVEARLREPRLTAPVYSTTTRNGSALSIQAAEARPAQKAGDPSTAADVTASLTATDGKRTDLTAASAELDDKTDLLHLKGDVVITDPSGYRIETDALDADLATTAFHSPTAVRATGPTGTITADSMSLTPNPLTDGTYLLVFKGRVKLVYQPK